MGRQGELQQNGYIELEETVGDVMRYALDFLSDDSGCKHAGGERWQMKSIFIG